MQLRSDQLANSLKKHLAPIYFVSGDEPLLIQEACDQIRHAARYSGYREREVLQAEANFDWHYLLSSANALSLFADKKLIELRLPSGKPSDKGVALASYAENPPPDTLLLIISGKLESAAKRAKWYNTILECGVFVPIWPIDEKQLPQWISQRLKENGLKATGDAIRLLVDKVEGNLLAAAQEIEKLKLFANDSVIGVDTITEAVCDSARYNVFTLVDKAMRGEITEAAKALNGLKGEAVDPTIILWAFARELRGLYEMRLLMNKGINVENAMTKQHVWDKRKPLTKATLNRLSLDDIEELILLATNIDHTIKGLARGSSWSLLTDLIFTLAGYKILQA